MRSADGGCTARSGLTSPRSHDRSTLSCAAGCSTTGRSTLCTESTPVTHQLLSEALDPQEVQTAAHHQEGRGIARNASQASIPGPSPTGHGRAVPPATQQAAGVAPPPASGGGPPLSLPDHHRTTARAAGCSAMTFVGTGAAVAIQAAVPRRNGRVRRRCQPARPTAVRETGLMWAKALRAFQVGKARTSHEGPWSWMRRSRVASAQVSCPACHLTKASASAVM